MGMQAVRNIEYHYQIKPDLNNIFLKYFAATTQFISWPIIFIFFTVLYSVEINGRENLFKIKSPFIIISNHVAIFDSFIFRLVLGVHSNHLPLRFMAVKDFDNPILKILKRIYIVDIIYHIFGVFVVYQGRGIHRNLQEAIKIIKNKGNVVIYPEGSITNHGKIGEFKHGASVLAKTTGASVLPISMKIIKGKIRNKFIVNIGRDIKYNKFDSISEITRIFHSVISKLHYKS
jgi:1-acyl-sn-glycerol-3-phosphate acyltransferase